MDKVEIVATVATIFVLFLDVYGLILNGFGIFK